MVVGPVLGLASVTLSVGRDDPEPPFGAARAASPLINWAAQTGQSEPARPWRGQQATAAARAPPASAPGRPGSGVLDARQLAEGQRLNSEVHGRDLTGWAGPWTRRAASRIPSTDTRPKTNVKMVIRASPGATTVRQPGGLRAILREARRPECCGVPGDEDACPRLGEVSRVRVVRQQRCQRGEENRVDEYQRGHRQEQHFHRARQS